MASRGSKLSKAVQFFREANLDEARVAFQLVGEIMDARLDEAINASKASRPKAVRRTRKAKTNASETVQPTHPQSGIPID